MNLFKVLAHRPLVLPLATVGALVMVALSELALRQTMQTLVHDELGALLTSAKPDAARIRLRLRLAGTMPEVPG